MNVLGFDYIRRYFKTFFKRFEVNKIGNKNNPLFGCFFNQPILTYITKILTPPKKLFSKLSKLSKGCCFTPYRSFENVLKMKKILLILVSLVMLATPIQAGVIDITINGFPLLDTTIIDCRSCHCAYEHSHIPSAIWCPDTSMIQLNDDCIVYGDGDTCTNFCDNLSLIYPNITIFKLLDYDSLLEAPATTTFDNKPNLGLGIIVAIAGISFLVLIAIMERKGRKGE